MNDKQVADQEMLVHVKTLMSRRKYAAARSILINMTHNAEARKLLANIDQTDRSRAGIFLRMLAFIVFAAAVFILITYLTG